MWIVDPVDGTTNFSKSNPHYSTQIALYTENRVVLAVTYDHNRKETFHAIEGQGAYLNNKRIWVSKTKELREATSHVGLQYSSETSFERITRRINRAIKICRGVRITGSACLDFAYVAAGRADIFWEEKLKPWDVASGVLLVKEAGGFVGSCLKEPLDLLDPNVLVANNSPELVEEFRERVLYD
jgi:myo-inositol-1(or 4)-monophosphatase